MKFNDLRDESRFFFKILILAAKEIIEVLKDTRHSYVCEVGDHVSKVYLDEMKNLMKKNKPKKKGGKKSKKSKKK